MRQCAIGGDQGPKNTGDLLTIKLENSPPLTRNKKHGQMIFSFLSGFSGVLFALKVVNSYHSHRLPNDDGVNHHDRLLSLLISTATIHKSS